MNTEDFINIMQGKSPNGPQQPQAPAVPSAALLDKFIDAMVAEHDYTLYSVLQEANFRQNKSPIRSFAEVEVLPHLINRINVRISEGEK